MPLQPAKSLATLSSGLLARKGQARPAMRSQGFGTGTPHAHPQSLDDLGWNDMGIIAQSPSDAEILAQHLTDDPQIAFPEIPKPAVLVEREALAQQVAAPPVVKPVSAATAARLRRETAHDGKAAFTLRLDADRHLRLRLASAITNRSAQALVAQALDQLLSTLPEVETLVAQLPPAKRRTK